MESLKNLKKLTSVLESILFVSGNAVNITMLAEKLQLTEQEIKEAAKLLQEEYRNKKHSGIQLLIFNKKLQLTTNPEYKEYITAVLNPIKEREFTKTILECAAIIAYKQPITKGELEELRGVNSDYPIATLLELNMIEAVGKKDTIGRPILYATTDTFLKRFQLSSIQDLPDYNTLMQTIAKLRAPETEENYLYANHVYNESNTENSEQLLEKTIASVEEKIEEYFEENLPDFLSKLEDELIKIE